MKSSSRFLVRLILFCYLLRLGEAVAPVFTASSPPSPITEGLAPGSFYYTFQATPLNVVTYSLDAEASKWLSINSSTGVTKVKKTIDRETIGDLFIYKVFATASSSPSPNKAEHRVIQSIIDINDNNPVFTNLPRIITIKEDLAVGGSVYDVTVTDEDKAPSNIVDFAIESGNEEGMFDITTDVKIGKIELKKSLDFDEGTKQFVLQVIANNSKQAPYLKSTSVLTINVQDVDDLGAKFVKNLYESTIVKDSLVGTVVTTVQAHDRDSFNATVEYKIYQETNPGNLYKINNRTGEITVNGALDIGTQLLVVTGTSTVHIPAFTVVKVTVASMLNMSKTVYVVEGESSVVILNLESAEQYYNVTGGSFSILSGRQTNLFTIDGKDLKVGAQPLDREKQQQYQLNIALDKDGATKGLVMVTITVLDINDNQPSFQGDLPYNASVREDADIGRSIFRVSAIDKDEGLNGTVKYAIIGGDQSGLFSMDNITGQISLAGTLDREKTALYTLTIEAYDGGSPRMTNTTTVIVNVKDVNDNSPVINQTSITKTLYEWTTNGTQVAVIRATDADSGDNARITYVIQEGADNKFFIDPMTGVITTIGGLSYTTKPRYTIIVTARDNGLSSRSATAVVSVIVEPRNNKTYTVQVTEGIADITVMNLQLVEQDYNVNGASLLLISGNDDNHFLINASARTLKVGAQPLDREFNQEYKLGIQVEKDGFTRGYVMVTVIVLDINDNSPVFQGDIPYKVNISEDAAVNTLILKVLATDSDTGLNGTVKYAITAGNEQGYFSMDNITGQISLAGTLDREKTALYTLTIEAYDGGSPRMTNTTTVIVNVNDVNDNSPVINQTYVTKTLSEWATNGTEVAVIRATDADSGDNGRITYVIQEGGDNKFVIDPVTGVIITTGGLSFKTNPRYTLIVNARDNGLSSRSATAVVSVIVEPRTNKTYTVQVNEGSSDITVMNLQVVEQDYSATGANFSITAGDDDNHFVIDAAAKNLKISSQPLDRELKDEYQLQITLVNDGKIIGVAMVNIIVLDANDNSPAFQGIIPYNITVLEDTEIGESIVKVTAIDRDAGVNGTVRYAISAGNQEGLFSIDNTTGQITLSKMLDRETTDLHNLTIQAYDGGSPPMTSSATVLINVKDVNDNSPKFTEKTINKTVSEDASNGFNITKVTATDADRGENSKITYILEGSYGKFVIDGNTGVITTTGGLSFKERPKYTIIVIATDGGLSPRSTAVLVYITVTSAGVNLYNPVFKRSEYLGGVYKDTSDGTVVLTVSAEDKDSGTNGKVDYSLTENKASDFFYMENSGRLQTSNSFVGKEGNIYVLKAKATDQGSSSKSSVPEAELRVFVLRDSHSMVLTVGIHQDDVLRRYDELLKDLGDLIGGKAFIKSVRPMDGDKNSTIVIFNVVKNKTELTSMQIKSLLDVKKDTSTYTKWAIRQYEAPKTAALISSEGLSAVVGAMICLALMIGVGGIIMIIILLKKRREREMARKNTRVTFSDKLSFINIDGNLPVSRLNVESAQEVREGFANMPDDSSSVESEEVETSPDAMDYINQAFHNDDDDEVHNDENHNEGAFYSDERGVNFGTFFPPPPTEPPPPVPDSDNGDSVSSEEESINSDEEPDYINAVTPPHEEPDYINAVIPPHEDFADPGHLQQNGGEPSRESPTHSFTDSTTQLVNPNTYTDTLLHDHTLGYGQLFRRSSNPEQTTEL